MVVLADPYDLPLIFLPSIEIRLPRMVCFFSESLLRKPCDLHEASHEAGSSESGLPDLHTDLGAGPMFSLVPMISVTRILVFMSVATGHDSVWFTTGSRPSRLTRGSRQAHDGAHDRLTTGPNHDPILAGWICGFFSSLNFGHDV